MMLDKAKKYYEEIKQKNKERIRLPRGVYNKSEMKLKGD